MQDVLLDADQPIPPLVDEVYYRWRFYYEDEAGVTTPPQETYHVEWQFGHIEYSVPKAPEGTPPEKAVHTLTSNFTVKDMVALYGAQCAGSEGASAAACDPRADRWAGRPLRTSPREWRGRHPCTRPCSLAHQQMHS